ncbi:nucleotide-diphospho-sugar transferase [Fadolivirus algeromassiliense]|jgi:hypothetical protein|uniref:Nucleotide-diphospho-sugar transferase n=1 Tax=Fadolivirus FV1/VV64 TaxID=3070911 RepID=A0A7D3QUY5_9VIRU|nr:nucleotide-diphospho-sugar transferase [Fadolivirus algeromassiliense]QKF94563.1 nucleotide-diphospho-sugar transferase [Fadolivirus FV1/VV64]
MKISIIKSIFCPTDKYFNISCNAIKNLCELINNNIDNSLNFDITIIGWIKQQHYGDDIIKIVDDNINNNSNIRYILWNLNYGKYYMFNKLQEIIDNNTSYILYADHDILFNIDHIKLFSDLIALYQYKINNKNIGLIALNHLEDNRHKISLYCNENKITINDTTLYYISNNDYGSMACGCIFLSYECFKLLNKLDNISVYGLDDFNIIKKINDNNYISILTPHISIIHPFDENVEYIKWKENTVKLLIENKQFDYYKSLESSINFWR